MGNVHLNRLEAMALLKELVASELVNPDYLSIHKEKSGNCQIQIKCDYNKAHLEEYAKKNGLTMTEDKEREYFVIAKP